MRDILADLDSWRQSGETIAVATVIQTWGSAPRKVGAKMALSASGKITGSVSGGCVEGAVVQAGKEVLKTGRPRLLHFGVTNEAAWEVGLACGGSIEVFVESLDSTPFEPLRKALIEERPLAVATTISGPTALVGRGILVLERGERTGSINAAFDAEAESLARSALDEGRSRRISLSSVDAEGRPHAENVEVFIEVFLPSPTLISVGGVHIAIALTQLASTLGFSTVVIDPRRTFGTRERFPHVNKLVQDWPDKALTHLDLTRSTAVAMLTHDPKLDDPALQVALPSPAFYVGALGSRKTQEARRKRLLDAGITEAQLGRLHGPIGLDIGAQSPEEIALAIMAEVVAARHATASH